MCAKKVFIEVYSTPANDGKCEKFSEKLYTAEMIP